jgi:pantetheine-phosphate adenylyltransferase
VLAIIERGANLGNQLIVAVSLNSGKHPLFSIKERTALVTAEVERINAAQKSTASVLVKSFCGLLTDFATEQGATSILRGLRAVSDFEYEFQMVGMNRQLNSEIETVFLMADAQRQSISSNFIRDIARLNGEISNFTTDYVSGKLKQKFKN